MKEKIDILKGLIEIPGKATVFGHVNPDGDALGSGRAWAEILRKNGHQARFFVPNNYPSFLEWANTGTGRAEIYEGTEEQKNYIGSAELLFFLDLNSMSRIDAVAGAVERNTEGKKILIDHHPQPDDIFDLSFSDTGASSTSLIVYRLIKELGMEDMVDKSMAESIYIGISTDTGNFTFGNLDAELYRTVAALVDKGIDTAGLNVKLYNVYTKERLRLLGYLLDRKMIFIEGTRAAYICLSQADQTAFNFKQGDSEGFVNFPLNVADVDISGIFIQTNECIKVSLRSKGEFDTNTLARRYFNGGGHKNASGGKFFDTMENAVRFFRKAVLESR